MKSPRISVIVPVYHAEDTIVDCVESILRQTFTDFDVVLVDDGSSDGSGRLCDRCAERDRRVSVIHQENKGRTEARAVGVTQSHGEWICFVDADDRLPAHSLDTLYRCVSDEVDIVLGNGYSLGGWSQPLIDMAEFRHLAVRAEGTIGVPWGSLYRRSVITPYLFDLPRDIINGEDYLFWLRLVFQTDKPVAVVHDAVYDKGAEHTSNCFVWTADYCYRLNELRKASIPAEQYQLYLADTISDRMANMYSVAMWSPRSDWKNSKFYRELLADMRQQGITLSLKSRIYFSLPSRRLRKIYSLISQFYHLKF